jgi:hypothetical protein
MLSASSYSTACTGLQGTRGRALSQALYMYTCATQAVAAQTAGAARTRVQSHYDVQQPRLHNTLSALLSSHAASRGGEIRFRRARARAANTSAMSGS